MSHPVLRAILIYISLTSVADTTTSTTTASEMTLIPDSKSHRQMAMSSVIDTNLPRISEKFAPSDSHGSKQLAATGGDSSTGISAVTVPEGAFCPFFVRWGTVY